MAVNIRELKLSELKPYRNNPRRNDGAVEAVALCARGIKSSSQVGDIVVDLFGGSGTTLIAAEQLGRKCRMMELDERYCDVIVRRWEQLTGKKAEKTTKPRK